jgi:hypothetical protein
MINKKISMKLIFEEAQKAHYISLFVKYYVLFFLVKNHQKTTGILFLNRCFL